MYVLFVDTVAKLKRELLSSTSNVQTENNNTLLRIYQTSFVFVVLYILFGIWFIGMSQ